MDLSSLRGCPVSGGLCRLRLSVKHLFQATVQMEDGKVVVDFPNYHQTSEILGDKLVEVSIMLVPGITDQNTLLAQPGPLRWNGGRLALGALSACRLCQVWGAHHLI